MNVHHLYLVLFLFLILSACASPRRAENNAMARLLIVCDSVQWNDSVFYDPGFFRVNHDYILYWKDAREKTLFDRMENSAVCRCNNEKFGVRMDLKQNGFIEFSSQNNVTKFRIRTIIND